MKGFRFGSTQGAFYILPGQEGWEATYGNQTLGEFSSPQQAADDLARGLTCSHLSEGDDTSTLEIPEKLSEWEIVHV
ncbi:hypothetical protein AAGS40_16485 [Paraburkholderia sp. PREW-6R]|uniref:hypothetical protein n=1 Tax=Paraburkholderia sp. PREW-6R TaxID=3141544 RepID=UPI0031F5C841